MLVVDQKYTLYNVASSGRGVGQVYFDGSKDAQTDFVFCFCGAQHTRGF